MLFIYYRPHSCCLTHAGGSHCHHWRAAAKAAACLSKLTSQGWVTHTSFDSKIGGSPGLGKGESDSWPQIKGSFAPIGRGWQELVLKWDRSPLRSPGQGTQHHSPTPLPFVNYQHTWDAQQKEWDLLDSCTSNICMHVTQELVLCSKFSILATNTLLYNFPDYRLPLLACPAHFAASAWIPPPQWFAAAGLHSHLLL